MVGYSVVSIRKKREEGKKHEIWAIKGWMPAIIKKRIICYHIDPYNQSPTSIKSTSSSHWSSTCYLLVIRWCRHMTIIFLLLWVIIIHEKEYLIHVRRSTIFFFQPVEDHHAHPLTKLQYTYYSRQCEMPENSPSVDQISEAWIKILMIPAIWVLENNNLILPILPTLLENLHSLWE